MWMASISGLGASGRPPRGRYSRSRTSGFVPPPILFLNNMHKNGRLIFLVKWMGRRIMGPLRRSWAKLSAQLHTLSGAPVFRQSIKAKGESRRGNIREGKSDFYDSLFFLAAGTVRRKVFRYLISAWADYVVSLLVGGHYRLNESWMPADFFVLANAGPIGEVGVWDSNEANLAEALDAKIAISFQTEELVNKAEIEGSPNGARKNKHVDDGSIWPWCWRIGLLRRQRPFVVTRLSGHQLFWLLAQNSVYSVFHWLFRRFHCRLPALIGNLCRIPKSLPAFLSQVATLFCVRTGWVILGQINTGEIQFFESKILHSHFCQLSVSSFFFIHVLWISVRAEYVDSKEQAFPSSGEISVFPLKIRDEESGS